MQEKENAVEGGQFSIRDADVSYDALASKPNMQIVTLMDALKTNDRNRIVDAGMQSALSNGSAGVSGMPAVYIEDIGKSVNVSRKSLKHGLDRRTADQSPVIQHIGELLKNAILVNLESFDVLYAVRTKKGDAASMARALTDEGLSRNVSTISIADLLENVKEKFSDVMSDDVISHFEIERNRTEITDYLRYSTRDLPDTPSIREYLRAMKPTSRMTETEKLLRKKYKANLAALAENAHHSSPFLHIKFIRSLDKGCHMRV